MNDLGWRADGIARALAAGGVELEVYRQPGYVARTSVRRASPGLHAQGFEAWGADEPAAWADPTVHRPAPR